MRRQQQVCEPQQMQMSQQLRETSLTMLVSTVLVSVVKKKIGKSFTVKEKLKTKGPPFYSSSSSSSKNRHGQTICDLLNVLILQSELEESEILVS